VREDLHDPDLGLKEGQRTEGKALNLKTRTSGYHRTLELALLGRSGSFFLFLFVSLKIGFQAVTPVVSMVSPPQSKSGEF